MIFSPILPPGVKAKDSAKPGLGYLDSEGKYVISTYTRGKGDGAAVGKHLVIVNQLDPDDDEAPITNKGFACKVQDTPLEYEVKADVDNEFDIKL